MSAAPAWPLAAAGAAFLAIGVGFLAWPRPAIAFYVRLIRPMHGLFGWLIDWEIGLAESRAATVLVRLFGGFVILSAGAIFFYAAGAPR